MAEDMNRGKSEETPIGIHKAARPIEYLNDGDGYGWLCDNGIDPGQDFRAQGCWRCDEMAFPDGGR